MARSPLTAPPARRTAYKFLGAALALSLLVLFWDALLPLLGEGLHLLLELVEVMLEHVLEGLLGWTPRQAQTLLAWGALAFLLYGLAWLARKAHAAALRAAAAARLYANACAERARTARGRLSWLHFAGLGLAAGLALYLFL